MTTLAERLPNGWRLDSISFAPGAPSPYVCILSLVTAVDTVHVQGTADNFEDALDLALQRAREFAPVQQYLGRLASCHRDSEGRWLMESFDGALAGHQNPDEAARMLGIVLP